MASSIISGGALRRSTEMLVNIALAAGVFVAVVLEAWLRQVGQIPAEVAGDEESHDEPEDLLGEEPWEALGDATWWMVLLIAVVAAACILAQRRWPVLATVAMGATAVASVTLIDLSLSVAAAFGLTLYTLAAERGWLAGLAAGAASISVVAVLAAVSDREGEALLVTAFAVVIVVVPLLAAANARSRRAYLAEVQARLAQARAEQSAVAAQAVADERVRLARDLHDVLAHSLTVVNLQVGVAAHLVPDHPDRALRALEEARQAGTAAVGELRTTLALMRGDEPEGTAPVSSLGDIESLVNSVRQTGLSVELHEHLDPGFAVGEAVGLVAFRVVQEGLTNVVRHAGVEAEAKVSVETSASGVCVRVADTGGNAPPAPGSGLGLKGLAERCRALGGEFTAGAAPGGGFAIQAQLPLAGPTPQEGEEES